MWRHLIKLLRHIVMIITHVPNFHYVFILCQSILFHDMNLFYLHLPFLSWDLYVHALDLSDLTYISIRRF